MDRAAVAAGRVGTALAVAGAMVAIIAAVAVGHDLFMILVASLSVGLLSVPIVGAAVVRAAPRNPVGWIVLASGTCLPVAIAGYLYARAALEHGQDLPGARWAGWVDGWPWVPGIMLVPTVGLLLFPDGRLPSPRWRPVLVLEIALAATLVFGTVGSTNLLDFRDVANPTALPGSAGGLASALLALILLVAPLSTMSAIALTGRLRRTTDPASRQMLRGVLPAAWLIVLSWWGCVALGLVGRGTINALPVEAVAMIALAGACWVAIRRHGLFDARLVVRRGLVYGALTSCVALTYVVVASLLATLGAGHIAAPIAVASGVAVAIPLKDALQRAANRLVFGLRDDPFATFVRMADELENAAATEDVLPATAAVVRETLRLQHVQILLGAAEDTELLTEAGVAGSRREVEIPLVYSGERVGTLLIEPTDGDGGLAPAARELLSGIAGPIAAAARATALTRDLAASRERLVAATAEERRRLRRDLHDGLGPTLSSAVLGISRAHDLVTTDPSAALRQLEQLSGLVQEAVADIRRLVYGLRPPALDELGLVGALDEQARGFGSIQVQGPRHPLALSAAVEVAAYRIAMEAMTNASRHGRAPSVTVQVCVDDSLRLEVADDGVGLPSGFRAGVGISSMRERASELGGECTVGPRVPRGTLVRAVLPLGPA